MTYPIRKNAEGNRVRVVAVDVNGRVINDEANITATIELDNSGTPVATNDVNPTPVLDEDDAQTGYYDFDLTQLESNADIISFVSVSSSAGVVVFTEPSTILPTVDSQADSGNVNNIEQIVIGDDYVSDNNRQLYVDITPGYIPVGCKIGAKGRKNSWLATGSVVSLGSGSYRLLFSVARTDTDGFVPGDYKLSVEAVDSEGDEHTVLRKMVPHVWKQT